MKILRAVRDVAPGPLIAWLACALGAMALAPTVASALARSDARLEGLRLLSVTDSVVWVAAISSLLSSSRLAPPAYIPLLGLVPHVLYLGGLIVLASTVVALGRSAGRGWAPFTFGAVAAMLSALTAAPDWFWGVTGLFFSVPPAIVEVLAVGLLCARIEPPVHRTLMRPPRLR